MNNIKNYLENLLTEKQICNSVDEDINGITSEFYGEVVGFTYRDVIEFVASMPAPITEKIRKTFVKIDFCNGDVMHFFKHLTNGMFQTQGLDYSIA